MCQVRTGGPASQLPWRVSGELAHGQPRKGLSGITTRLGSIDEPESWSLTFGQCTSAQNLGVGGTEMEGGAQGQPRCQSSRVQVQDRGTALLTRRGRQEPPKVGTLTRVPESFGGHEESCKRQFSGELLQVLLLVSSLLWPAACPCSPLTAIRPLLCIAQSMRQRDLNHLPSRLHHHHTEMTLVAIFLQGTEVLFF